MQLKGEEQGARLMYCTSHCCDAHQLGSNEDFKAPHLYEMTVTSAWTVCGYDASSKRVVF